MGRLTIRVSDDLGARVRTAASRNATSVNAYVAWVLEAATKSELSDLVVRDRRGPDDPAVGAL